MATTKQDLKNSVCKAIDRNAERIIGLGERIRRQPELGFKEFKTARLAEETLTELGLKPRSGLAITGVRAEVAGTKDGPTFALLGELDGLVVQGHPIADPETGAATLGQVLPNGPRGRPFVAPVGAWRRDADGYSQVTYPAAPDGWRQQVQGKGWRGW